MLAGPRKPSELDKFLEGNHPFIQHLSTAVVAAPLVSGVSFLSHLSAGSHPAALAALAVATVGSAAVAVKCGDMMRELLADSKNAASGAISEAVQNVPFADVLIEAKSEILAQRDVANNQALELAASISGQKSSLDADHSIPSPWGRRPT
jgi:hypothetical protein